MYITLYFIVIRLPDSLHVVKDHILTLDPTDLTDDLLEKHLLAAETSIFAVACSAAAADFLHAEEVGGASGLVGGVATAWAREARMVEVAVGEVVVEAVEAVEVAVVAWWEWGRPWRQWWQRWG
ncbi:unnamed protein product [Closterium sp. NIES-65]|nr:unnamed protein product [Closterium sp. NIES-65]